MKSRTFLIRTFLVAPLIGRGQVGFLNFGQRPFLVVEFWLISHMNNRKLPNFKDLIHANKATICSSLKKVHWFSSFFQSECHELESQI